MLGALPPAQPPATSPGLLTLIALLDARRGVFIQSDDAALDAAAASALQDAPTASAGALADLLRSHGWDGSTFARPLDIPILASRLKAFLFDSLRHRGGGSYSTVFGCRSQLTGGPVVLKRLRLDPPAAKPGEGLPCTAVREVSLMRTLAASPHVVELLDVLWDATRLYLVMESLDCDLRQHLDTDPAARTLPNVKSFMYQILKGVAHAHAHRVMHRDLKPQNLFLDKRAGLVKVGDWGLARSFSVPLRPYTHEVVTLLYRAPELLMGAPVYSTAVDVWSCGCILAELASGQPLFMGDSEIGQLVAIFQLLGTPGEEAWGGVSSLPEWSPLFPQFRPRDLAEAVPQLDALGLDLLGSMLRYDPSQRIRCRAALAHAWFDDVRDAEEARGRAAGEAAQRARREAQARLAAAAAASAAQADGAASAGVGGTSHLLDLAPSNSGPAASGAHQPSQASAQTRASLPQACASAAAPHSQAP